MFLAKALKVVLILYNLAITGALMYQGAVSNRGPEDFVLFLFFIPVALYLVSSLVPTRSSPIRNISLFLGLIAATVLFAANLLGAKSTTEYIIAALVFPLPTFFWGSLIAKAFRRSPVPAKAKSQPRPSVAWEDLDRTALSTETAAVLVKSKSEELEKGTLAMEPAVAPAEVTEPSRRDFLKKAGGVGLGLIAWSILNPGKAGAAFFGSVPGPGTVAIKDTNDVKIDPAEKYPTSGYGISEIDDAGTTFYYGFVNKDGAWYILKEDDTAGDLAYRYAKGVSGFSTAWTNRSTQSYDYFDNTF